MTSFEIEAFLRIVETGTLTAAAEQLHITQPALSRLLSQLEEKMNARLIIRQKGVRSIRLTQTGQAFIPVAEKWRELFRETAAIQQEKTVCQLRISAVGSVASYLLSPIFQEFLLNNADIQLMFTVRHSYDSYLCVEHGDVDIAFVNDDFRFNMLEGQSLFRSPIRLLYQGELLDPVHPSGLDAHKEVRLPWNRAFDIWHDNWFGPDTVSRVRLDQMSLLEQFLREPGAWAAAPAYVANRIAERVASIHVYDLLEGPPDVVVSLLRRSHQNKETAERFLAVLQEQLAGTDGIEML